MLVLSRKVGERIRIDGGITLRVEEIRSGRVRLALDAPKSVRILRTELEPLFKEAFMIAPSVGRIVWFYPGVLDTIQRPQGEPLAAVIARVWTDSLVNLCVFDSNGLPAAKTSVPFIQDGAPRPEAGDAYCSWMPAP